MTSYTPVRLAFKVVEPEEGSNGKPPIIFAHGLLGSKQHWEEIPHKVANATKRRVYAIDARNHGDSEWSDVFNFDCNVDDLLHFMDYIHAPKAILVGHSMGGVTAMKAALREPERVEKLIVEDMSAKKPPPEVFGMVKMFIKLLRNAVEHVPSDVDEATAQKLIADYIMEQIAAGRPERVEKLTAEDISAKKLSPEVFGMVKMFIKLLRNAVKHVPSDVDEATAQKFIADHVIEQIPDERPEREEKFIAEDMNAKKPPPEVFGKVKMFVKLLRNAVEHVPSDVDEETAQKLIADHVMEKIPDERPESVEKLVAEDISAKKPSPEVFGMVKMFINLLRNAGEHVPGDVDEETAQKLIADHIMEQIPVERITFMKPDFMKNMQLQLKRTEDGRYTFKANFNVLEKALENPSDLMTDIVGVSNGPAFFIYGKLSPIRVQSDEEIIKNHFPNAQLVGIENATHNVHTDCPKEFTEAVLKFILEE